MLRRSQVDNDEVKFYGYDDLSAMSNGRSKNLKAYTWIALITVTCGAFYWFNAPGAESVADAVPDSPAKSNVQFDFEAKSTTASLPDPQKRLDALSDEDRAMLQNLPSICVAEIPGVKKEDKPGCPATEDLAGLSSLAEMKGAPNGQASYPQTPIHETVSWNSEVAGQSSGYASTEVPAFVDRVGANDGDTVPANVTRDNASLTLQGWSPPVSASNAGTTNEANAKISSWVPPGSVSTIGSSVELQPAVQQASFDASHLESYNPHATATAKNKEAKLSTKEGAKEQLEALDVDPHLEAFSRSAFPSAVECAKCHEQIFEEWASSSHAYASISPMFHVFEDRINKLAQGTIGYFCMRCHAPVATTMGLRRDQAIWDGPRVFREGVTCVACHRVKTPYGKTNGERHMIPGGPEDPVVGGSDGRGVHQAAEKYADWFKTKTDPHSKKPGQLIHRRSIQFEELSKSTYCVSCHQVAVEPGIKLEVVWDQYRASPAYREGVTCQACHMGAIPGLDSGYTFGPAAVVDGKVVNPERKHSNHIFYGPGYSIAHPGIFPHNVEADRWTVNEWLAFDWRAGWGSEEFEKQMKMYGESYFPPPWDDVDTRMDAREIVDRNLEKLEYKKDLRVQLLENGSKLDGPFFADTPQVGQPLSFRYCLTNTNPGHNMPSGSLGAQPQIWMNVVLTGPDGQRLWETGYVDSNGDLCDNHSLDVLARRAPLDTQLMNLQTKFLVTNVKGTEREMYLPVPYEQDQIPFLRPAPQPVTVLNHPVGIRMEGHSLAPLGSRNVKYSVPSRLVTQRGTYTLSVRLRSRAEPIYFMRFCNATPEMMRMMNEWIADFHEQTVVFEVR
jgi:nitrate/TMAO reductase-like tetraheme cytochrome c subunit